MNISKVILLIFFFSIGLVSYCQETYNDNLSLDDFIYSDRMQYLQIILPKNALIYKESYFGGYDLVTYTDTIKTAIKDGYLFHRPVQLFVEYSDTELQWITLTYSKSQDFDNMKKNPLFVNRHTVIIDHQMPHSIISYAWPFNSFSEASENDDEISKHNLYLDFYQSIQNEIK